MNYCLDTNIIADIFRGNSVIKLNLEKIQSDTLFIPPIVLCELYKGAFLSSRIQDSLQFINQFKTSKGLLAADCVYRIMYYDNDDPLDFSKPHKKHGYAIHRLHKISYDKYGVKFKFKGTNNMFSDRYWARPKNILWISAGVLY